MYYQNLDVINLKYNQIMEKSYVLIEVKLLKEFTFAMNFISNLY
jgi:hypothetical protein